MDFDEYQNRAGALAEYPEIYVKDKNGEMIRADYIYPTLGLCGESGEVAEKIKKIVRNDEGVIFSGKQDEVKKELGDVLWYLQQLATEFKLDLEDVAVGNIEKLEDRKERNVIKSEGDNR